MEQITISLDEDLLEAFDHYLRRKGYENRSKAMRDLVRKRLEEDRLEEDRAEHAVACLSYVFNHEQRELARRLVHAQHEHHDLMLATLHVHLDHETCLEMVALQGHTPDVRRFAEATIAETGVRHGNLHLVPAEIVRSRHQHGPDDAVQDHVHTRPQT